MEKQYWMVVSKFFDNGKVKTIIVPVKSDRKPPNTMCDSKLCDEYHDYFDTYKEAREYAMDAEKA